MGRIKQSIAWWCFARRVEPMELIKKAAQIGYASIEMLPREYWDAVLDHGMKIAIIGGHGTLTDGLNRRENHDRIEEELSRNIELAAEYGIPSLICFSGNRRGLPDDEGIQITAEGLRRVAKMAEEKGVQLCLELLNSKVNHPDYQCDHTWWGVEVCKAVNSPAVKLLYDIYHMQIMEGDLIRTIKENIDYIGHFHTAGNPGRHDLDDEQEINYRAVMKAIAETNYTGFVGHEFTPKGDPIEALERTFSLCDV
ncbi:TIM barrel protein [Candidatus Poribacteria bacterium]|nr:TIM barrel protein [Candidatus Poribacteria bacterium]HDO75827.1 xylose isomerase [Candidatus Poribacteria bacterium]HEX29432.1 xylose isomerase [Candidatus Poribacteria bacterium]